MVLQREPKHSMSKDKPKKDLSERKDTPKIQTDHRELHWFSLPKPVRRVFEQFPLVQHRPNVLPQRASRTRRDVNVLYIFATTSDSSSSNFSCNPACLKWQAFLKFNDIPFSVKASNNHASPSGSLPFLLSKQSPQQPQPDIVPSSRIARWVTSQSQEVEEPLNARYEIYSALIEHNIRNAWLYHLYLDNTNFEAVAKPCYVSSISTNPLVQKAVSYQLRDAAQQELLKSRILIDKDELYGDARTAFGALSVLLEDDKYFSKSGGPGLFDASVFAYTHLLLDKTMKWQNTTLQESLSKYPRLIDHHDRLLDLCIQD